MNRSELIEKMQIMMRRRFRLRVQRNAKNLATGEIAKGKIEYGWIILNIQGDIATLCREGSTDIFYAKAQHLFELNKEIFEAV